MVSEYNDNEGRRRRGLRAGIVLFFCASLGLAGCEQDRITHIAEEDFGPLVPVTDTPREFDDYLLHFSAFTTDQLTPDVARAYQLRRARNRVVLVVNIQQRNGNAGEHSVRGDVDAFTRNLYAQVKDLGMREVSVDDAVYYVGDITVGHEETLIFHISAIPEGESDRLAVRFRQTFYTR